MKPSRFPGLYVPTPASVFTSSIHVLALEVSRTVEAVCFVSMLQFFRQCCPLSCWQGERSPSGLVSNGVFPPPNPPPFHLTVFTAISIFLLTKASPPSELFLSPALFSFLLWPPFFFPVRLSAANTGSLLRKSSLPRTRTPPGVFSGC